jgi:hypothetical protein
MKIRPGTISSVYLGPESNTPFASEVEHLLREKHAEAKIYKANKKVGQFGLDFVKL